MNGIDVFEEADHVNDIFRAGPRATSCLLAPCWWLPWLKA